MVGAFDFDPPPHPTATDASIPRVTDAPHAFLVMRPP